MTKKELREKTREMVKYLLPKEDDEVIDNYTETMVSITEEYRESLRHNSWREKLIALMEGLEVQQIDEFILKAKKGDYRKLGIAMQERIKELINKVD